MKRSFKSEGSKLINHRSSRRVLILIGALGAAAVGFVSVAMAQQPGGARQQLSATVGDPGTIASSIINQLGSGRVNSMTLQGSTASVVGTASDAGAETARTLWYEAVAGVAFAQQVQATTLTRTVVDGAGNVIDTEQDRLTVGGLSSSLPTSAGNLTSGLADRALGVNANVGTIRYIPLIGGTAEVVIQPNSPASFVKSAGENVGSILGPMSANNGAYLVTVVGSNGSPLLVLGNVPALGGDAGQGIGWQAPGVQSDAMWGAYLPTKRSG